MTTNKIKNLFFMAFLIIGFFVINESMYKIVKLVSRAVVGYEYVTVGYVASEIWVALIMLAASLFFLILSRGVSSKVYRRMYLVVLFWPVGRLFLVIDQLSGPAVIKDKEYYTIISGELVFLVIAFFVLININKVNAVMVFFRKKIREAP